MAFGLPPLEPDPDDTYRWADERMTQVVWHQGDSGIEYWVPVTEPPLPMNADWLRIKGWLDAGLIIIDDPLPPDQPVPRETP